MRDRELWFTIQRVFPLPIRVQIFTKERLLPLVFERSCHDVVGLQSGGKSWATTVQQHGQETTIMNILVYCIMHRWRVIRHPALLYCEVYIRTRRCASRAHRCIQPIETDLSKHIRFLLLFQNLRSSVTMIVSIPFDSSYCLHSSKLLIFFFFFF